MIAFATPAGGITTLVAPGANTFPGPGTPPIFTPTANLDWVIQSAYIASISGASPFGWPVRGPSDGFALFSSHDLGTGTNYAVALYALRTLLTSVTTPNTVVAFLSDGRPNATVPGQTLASIIAIAGVVASKLSSISLSTDGGPAVPVLSTSPPLSLTGPASLTWTQAISPAAGTRRIGATANGSDGGGPGSIEECVTVTLLAPPLVSPSDASGAEGANIPITGTVTSAGSPTHHWNVTPVPGDDVGASCVVADPSALSTTVNGPFAVTWDFQAFSGVDPGATCTFADPHSATTTVWCSDDGHYRIELSANDGVNPTVSVFADLTVSNVGPSVSIASRLRTRMPRLR